jgi:hypothetical protein
MSRSVGKARREAAQYEKRMERDRMTNEPKYLLPAADERLTAANAALVQAQLKDHGILKAELAVEQAEQDRAAAIIFDRETRIREGDESEAERAARWHAYKAGQTDLRREYDESVAGEDASNL